MTSEKQIEANRQNAQAGGVRTSEGKAISRMNALKFGFFSRLVTDYDKLQAAEFCQEVYDCFKPTSIFEEELVEMLLTHLLCFRRICLVENELIRKRLNPTIVEDSIEAQLSRLNVLQKGYESLLQADVIEELERFARYKTAAVNLIFKTQHELERLTRMRQGECLPPPTVGDVNISISNP